MPSLLHLYPLMQLHHLDRIERFCHRIYRVLSEFLDESLYP